MPDPSESQSVCRVCECCGYRGGNEDGWITDPEYGIDLCGRCVADMQAADESPLSPLVGTDDEAADG